MRTKSALSMKKATNDLFLSSSKASSIFFCKGDTQTTHMTQRHVMMAAGASNWPLTYLARLLVEGDICLDAQRPIDVDNILVELEQEHNENKDGIQHGE